MKDIQLEHNPSPGQLKKLGVSSWPIWEKEESEFSWSYDSDEQCLILEGEATVTPDGGGKAVQIAKGNFVTFPAGMSCTWKIHRKIRKHYNFP